MINENTTKSTKKSFTGWIILAGVVLFVYYLISVYNTAVRFENELQAAYDNNQNVLSNSFYQPLEVAKLGETKYRTMLVDMIKETSKGYEGASGGKAMMLWVQKNIPDAKPDLAMKLVSIGEAGSAKFQSAQTNILDRGRAFKDFLETIPSGFVAGTMGFPKKVNLKDILTPVTDEATDTSFKTKKRVPVTP